MSHVVRLTDGNFESEVLNADLPVLVEFWGSWCPPCKMMEPTLEQLAIEYDGYLKVGKINVDQNPRVATRYKIQGAPTFIIFSLSEAKDRRTGAQSKSQLEDWLDKAGVRPSEPEIAQELDEGKIRKRLSALGYLE